MSCFVTKIYVLVYRGILNRSIFYIWKPNIIRDSNTYKNIKTMNINFGPQHPAAHGVLRLILQLNGEVVERLDPHIGLLHRGSEKLIEDKHYLLSMPYFDRFDYCSMLVQEHAYCLGIETILSTTNYTSTLTQVRTLFDELTRILNHMLAIACHALDVGSMSSIFWAFEEREKIMEFYERVSGARMHAAFYKPNDTVWDNINSQLLEDILEFSKNCFSTLNEMHNILTFNKIWKHRLVNIGIYSYKTCLDYGLTGVMSRSVGIKRDLRLSKLETYANYYFLNFRGFIGQHGDCYDRFLIRMCEMSESINIITQVIGKIVKFRKNNTITNTHSILNYTNTQMKTTTKNQYTSMEYIIKHFKYWSEGLQVKPNWAYSAVESPKGEFAVSLISDGTATPYRCKVRSPAFHNLHSLPHITKGHFLADLVALIGTIDVVFGEVDR